MATHKSIDRICLAAALLSMLAALLLSGAGESQPRGTVMGYEARLFDTGKVHTIDIVMDDWDAFLETCENEEYSSCAVVIDGEACKNTGIRAKGNTSLSMVSSLNSSRYSFKLEFDCYETGQTYHGLDKLCLNNLIQDNTCMKDYLVYQMMAAFDVNAPLCSYAYVTVNGQDWGLYLAVESVEESFLQRTGCSQGELYKPDSLSMGGGRGNGRDFDMDAFDFEENGFPAPKDFQDRNREITAPANQADLPEERPENQTGSPNQAGMPESSAAVPAEFPENGGDGQEAAGQPDLPGNGGDGQEAAGQPDSPGNGGAGQEASGQPDLPGNGGAGQETSGQPDSPGNGGAGQEAAGQPDSPGNSGAGQEAFGQPDFAGNGGAGQEAAGQPDSPGNGGAGQEAAGQPDSPGNSGAGQEASGQPDFPGNGGAGQEASGQPDFAGNRPERPGGMGGMGGMGASDVKLQYTGDDPENYANIFGSAKTPVTNADQSRLIAALKTLGEGDPSALDMEQVLRYFVVHNFVCNGDSYTGNLVHNYYLYEESGRLSMIPWDYNLAFGGFQTGNAAAVVNDPIDTPQSVTGSGDRPMIDWIFSDPAYTEAYHQYFTGFLESIDPAALIEETSALIAPYLEKDPTKFCTYEEFQTAVQALTDFCRLRTESVAGQLAGEIPATSDGQAADSTALVDASGLNLSDMGSMGRGGGGFPGDRGQRNGNAGTATEPPAASAAVPDQPDAASTPAESEENRTPPDGIPTSMAFPGGPGAGGPPDFRGGRGEEAAAVSGEALLLLGGSVLALLAGFLLLKRYRRWGI